MFTTNPFALLSETIPPELMQLYVVLMIFCVVGGTLYDVAHKGSAKYFFSASRKSEKNAARDVESGEKISLAVKTAVSDVLTSSEFCNPQRRIAHLLGMYGFVLFVIATMVLVFGYPTSPEAGIWPFAWCAGAIMVCVGAGWFWLFIRADVSSEGQSPFRVMKADLFVLSLLGTCFFGLLWAFAQSVSGEQQFFFLLLFLVATTVLFGSVPWSKFSHMFFKPAAAYQKKIAVANGALDNLPRPADRTLAEDRDRHSMELLKDAPLNMGLGIKREQPNHH